MNQRGEYGQPRGHDRWALAISGGKPLQPGEADRAVGQIDAEMEMILDATYRAMGVDPTVLRRPVVADAAWMQRVRDAKTKAMQSPLWSFWETMISPKYDDWKVTREAFRTKPLTSWDDYVLWLTRARQLRGIVTDRGIKIDAPALVDLSRGAEASPADSSKLWKWGAIGAVVILGGVAVSMVGSSTKKEREAYDPYRYGYLSQ